MSVSKNCKKKHKLCGSERILTDIAEMYRRCLTFSVFSYPSLSGISSLSRFPVTNVVQRLSSSFLDRHPDPLRLIFARLFRLIDTLSRRRDQFSAYAVVTLFSPIYNRFENLASSRMRVTIWFVTSHGFLCAANSIKKGKLSIQKPQNMGEKKTAEFRSSAWVFGLPECSVIHCKNDRL